MKQYTLFNRDIVFDDAADRYYFIRREMENAADKAGGAYAYFYREGGNISDVLDEYAKAVLAITEKYAIEPLYEKLSEMDIYDVSRDEFEEECLDLEGCERYYDCIADKYNEIVDELASAKEYRAARKASRGRVVGGGFGVGNALKGMATAGAMNAVTGLAHGAANLIGNIGSSISASSAKSKLYESEKTLEILATGAMMCIKGTYVAFINFINAYMRKYNDDEDGHYIDFNVYDDEKAETLFENARQHPEKKTELLYRAVAAAPYNEEICEYIFMEYESERKSIYAIANSYGLDLSDVCEEILQNIYDDEANSSDEKRQEAKDRIRALMAEYGVSESDTLNELDYDALVSIYEQYYRPELPGKREHAIELFKKYKAEKSNKIEFIKDYRVWELVKNYGVELDEPTRYLMAIETYRVLREASAEEDHITAVLDSVLDALGFTDKSGKMPRKARPEMFNLMTGIAEAEADLDEEYQKIKGDHAAELNKFVNESLKGSGVTFMTTSLSYGSDDLDEKAQGLKYALPDKDEHALIIYEARPIMDPLGSGFCLTDQALFVNNEDGSRFNLYVSDIERFERSGVASSSITVYTNASKYKIDVSNLSEISAFVKCLNTLLAKLHGLLGRTERVRAELDRKLVAAQARCVEENAVLVRYFDMTEKADMILNAGKEAAEEQKKQQVQAEIDSIFASCNRSKPGTIADAWLKYLASDYPAELYAEKIDKLFIYLRRCVTDAKNSSSVRLAIVAIKQIGTAVEETRLSSLLHEAEIAEERLVAHERAEAVRRELDSIYSSCNPDDIQSIIDTRKKYTDSEYTKEQYADHLLKLDGAVQKLISDCTSIPVLEDMAKTIGESFDGAEAQTYAAAIAEQIGHVKDEEEKKRLDAIYSSCDLRDISSIMAAAEQIADSGCDPERCSSYSFRLAVSMRDLISGTDSLDALRAMAEKFDGDSHSGDFASQRETLLAKIKRIDEEQRTYKGILFDSADDIAAAIEAEKAISITMCTVSKDNAESIENAIAELEAVESPIKAHYIGILKGYLDEYSNKQRTYRGVTYETAEDAKAAEREYVEARDIMSRLDISDEDAVKAAYGIIGGYKHDSAKEFKKRLEEQLKIFDIKNRTVDGILFTTIQQADTARRELDGIMAVMSGLDADNEEMLIDARAKLSAFTTPVKTKYLEKVGTMLEQYDIKLRTYNGELYDTREYAALLRSEEACIREIMNSVSEDDENTMLAARNELQGLETFLGDEAILKVDDMLAAYDVRMRTFNGVVYETRERAELVRMEYRTAEEIMMGVSPDDEASILNAQREILRLTTEIKDEKYSQLKSMWEAYDLRKRTYENIVFDSREQAALARETREEFLSMFGSTDLRQKANIRILENYIEDTLHEKIRPEAVRMVGDVKAVVAEIDSIVEADSSINPAVNKKESAALHKRAEKIIPLMEQYRMNTAQLVYIKDRHYASLNAAQKLFSFIKSKI